MGTAPVLQWATLWSSVFVKENVDISFLCHEQGKANWGQKKCSCHWALLSWANRPGFNFILIALTPKILGNKIPVKPQFTFQVQNAQKESQTSPCSLKRSPHYKLMALYTGRPERCQASFLPTSSKFCKSSTKPVNHLLSTCSVPSSLQDSREMTRYGLCPWGWQPPGCAKHADKYLSGAFWCRAILCSSVGPAVEKGT